MNTLLQSKLKAIQSLAEQYGVKYLFVFGSFAEGLERNDSDIDFLVDFLTNDPAVYTENYFGLHAALSELLDRDIDLMTIRSIKNPILAASIDASKELLYAA